MALKKLVEHKSKERVEVYERDEFTLKRAKTSSINLTLTAMFSWADVIDCGEAMKLATLLGTIETVVVRFVCALVARMRDTLWRRREADVREASRVEVAVRIFFMSPCFFVSDENEAQITRNIRYFSESSSLYVRCWCKRKTVAKQRLSVAPSSSAYRFGSFSMCRALIQLGFCVGSDR